MKQTRIAGIVLLALGALSWALYRERARPADLEIARSPKDLECPSGAPCAGAPASVKTCDDSEHCKQPRPRLRQAKRSAPVAAAAGMEAVAASCRADSECPAGQHCALSTCRPNLGDGAPCDRPAMCTGGRCGQGVCCSVGVCCEQKDDCAAYYDCIDVFECRGLRTDRTCEDHHCVTERIADDPDACIGQVAQECGLYRAVYCEQGRPRRACAHACSSASDCRAGNACVHGTCTEGCQSTDECGREAVCLTGVCIQRCSRDRTCPSPFACIAMPESPGSSNTIEVCLDL